MKVKVNFTRIYLVVGNHEVLLTKAIARMFPLLPHEERWRAGEDGDPQPDPLGKLPGWVVDSPAQWVYLVKDEVAGLGWVRPYVDLAPGRAREVVKEGGWLDNLASVPTILISE